MLIQPPTQHAEPVLEEPNQENANEDGEHHFDDEEIQLFGHDDAASDNDDEEQEPIVTHGRARVERAAPKQKKTLFHHIKTSTPPLFLQSEPQWLQEAMEAAPIFCGLLSLCTPTRQGVEILKVADLEHSRWVY